MRFLTVLPITDLLLNTMFTPPHRCKRGSPLLKKEGKFSLVKLVLFFKIRIGKRMFLLLTEEEYAAKLWEVVRITFCHYLTVPNKIRWTLEMTINGKTIKNRPSKQSAYPGGFTIPPQP